MKIKTKAVILFLLSISMSVILFLLSTYYFLHVGYFSGITKQQMQKVLNQELDELQQTQDGISKSEQYEAFLKKAQERHEKYFFAMLFESKLLLPKMNKEETIEKQTDNSSSKLPMENKNIESDYICSVPKLMQAVQGENPLCEDYVFVASTLKENNQDAYLICYVKNSDFEALSYTFHNERAHGIFGKIALGGFFITVIILSVFMYFFSRGQMKRIEKMQQNMKAFALDRPQIRMDVSGRDELTTIATTFNQMADTIQQQIAEKNRYEEDRKQLVSNISHDLRTPLSSILGYAEMINNGIYESELEEKKYVDIIYRKAIYMDHLLGELLDYSRLELGRLAINKQQVDLTELLRELLIEYYPEMERDKFELLAEIPDKAIVGNWDADKLTRVFRNLIDNAIKYGMAGKKLRISLQTIDNTEDKKAEVIIQDYGAGIAQEKLEHVFEKFYRVNTGRSSKSGGMGLGMYISKEIVKLQGGTIEIESQIGEGTKIILKL